MTWRALVRFGWFGFNGASVGNLVGNTRAAARAMVMTALGGAAGGVGSALVSAYHEGGSGRSGPGQIHITATLNGILSGLVGITANCTTVRLEGTLVIGAVSGVCYFYS